MRALRLSASCPAPVATLPPRGSSPTLTFSMARILTFSMLCSVPHNIEDVAGRIMWRADRIVRLHVRTRQIPAT